MVPTTAKLSTTRVASAVALAPYALALFFGLWSLRGLDSKTPVDTDAARHAMNGVFLHDAVRQGDPLHVVAFAKAYYSRYPALSMPYHPPLFPAVEALFYFGLGVNLLSARLAVAAATAVSAALLYKLVLRTHGSHAVAAASTVIAFSLTSSLTLATDVMLEMPALALILAAMMLLPGLDGDGTYRVRRAIAFALAAGAAVWTKQNAVFLGLVPFVFIVLARRWRALKEPALWIPAALFGILAAGLALISASYGAAGNPKWPHFDLYRVLRHNVPFYAGAVPLEFGPAPALLLTVAIAIAIVKRPCRGSSGGNTPYVAWASSVFLVLFLLPPYDTRYAFFAYPAMVVVACSVLFSAAKAVLPGRAAWAVPAAVAALWFVAHILTPAVFLRGPFEAARLIAPSGPPRVLYCGRSNGNFIFALRTLDPAMRTTVIRGDKLPREIFGSSELEKFAHEYGVNYLVLERTILRRPWDKLLDAAPPSFAFVGDVPLASSDRKLNGTLRVFQFANPSPTPESTLKLETLGTPIEAELPPETASPEEASPRK